MLPSVRPRPRPEDAPRRRRAAAISGDVELGQLPDHDSFRFTRNPAQFPERISFKNDTVSKFPIRKVSMKEPYQSQTGTGCPERFHTCPLGCTAGIGRLLEHYESSR